MSHLINIHNLANYFDQSLDKIPENIRKLITQDASLSKWDKLSLAEKAIKVRDYERNYEDNFSQTLGFALVDTNDWLKNEIEKAQSTDNESRRLALIDAQKILSEAELFKQAEKHINQQAPDAFPKHKSNYLTLVNRAIEFFYNANVVNDPKKAHVIEWVKSEAQSVGFKCSNHMANAIFTIIKRDGHNPKIRKG